jgi:carboxyl-terminal processing protease
VRRLPTITPLSLALCALLLAACARTPPDAAAPAEGGGPAPSALSREDRAEIFGQVWRTIDEQYYDPKFRGVDWRAVGERYRPLAEAARSDAEFYGVFELMLAELRDGHTGFVPPPAPGAGADEGAARGSLGLRLGEVEGRAAVVEVEPGSAAERRGVRPGQLLREVNGKPVGEHFAFLRSKLAGSSTERLFKSKLLSALLYGGFLPTPRRLGLTDHDGREFEVELSPEPRPEPPNVTAKRLDSGLGYIKFRHWLPPAHEDFAKALSGLRDAPGLVIDVRGNGGGETRVMLDIAGNFFARETYYGGFRNRAGEVQKYHTRRHREVYLGPVVVLVDEESASATETFAAFVQETRRAAVVGRLTAGSTLNQGGRRGFKGGGQLRFSTRSYLTPAGRELEGAGVAPDVEVARTLADLRSGRDAALAEAEALLLRRAPPAPR